MCGSTTEEHTCTCCKPGEASRARGRRLYARHKAAKAKAQTDAAAQAEEVRAYRRLHRQLTPKPCVVLSEDGQSVEFLSADPKHDEAIRRTAELGPEVRTARGQVIWTNVPVEDRWMRQYEGKRPKPPVKLPAGLVDRDGRIHPKAEKSFPPEKLQDLRTLVGQNFADGDTDG